MKIPETFGGLIAFSWAFALFSAYMAHWAPSCSRQVSCATVPEVFWTFCMILSLFATVAFICFYFSTNADKPKDRS